MPRKKAMSSEKASQVKKDGHKNEDDFSLLVGGKKITGTGKKDCLLNDKQYSLKKICKRIQFSLYTKDSNYWEKTDKIHKACLECLNIYPSSFEEYTADKHNIKLKLAECMLNLKTLLKNNENLKHLLNFFIRNYTIDYIGFEFTTHHKIYDAIALIDYLSENLIVENSKKRKNGEYDNQKVILKASFNGKKPVNIIELEIRNSSATHYCEFLCVCNRDKLVELISTLPTHHVVDK
jgi:hypothetical protein